MAEITTSSRLGLLFAYLMTRTEEWDEAQNAKSRTEAEITKRLHGLRIEASVHVTTENMTGAYSPSRDASIMFVPLRLEGMTPRDPVGQPFSEQLASLPIVAMVAAHGDVQLRIEDETAIDESSPIIAATSPDKS